MTVVSSVEYAAEALLNVGAQAFQLGWVPATSGNFSCRLNSEQVAITVSGAHKGHLTPEEITVVGMDGRSLDGKRPSAETLLHIEVYRRYGGINSVLHTHSLQSTVLSGLVESSGELVIEGLEVLKAFYGVDTHETTLTIPVFANEQDMVALSEKLRARLDTPEPCHGFLIAGHGLYAWGRTIAETMRHLEAFEFLFQYQLEMKRIA